MKILECVPNFSEGRDKVKIDKILDSFRDRPGIKLLNSSYDYDHNRMVATLAGEPKAVKDAILDAIGKAVDLIDLNHHQGRHPRIGAVDVIPFIPLTGMDMEEASEIAKGLAQKASEKYALPIFLYEHSASASHRQNLENIRQGQFESLSSKLKNPEWIPDFGPGKPHPTAGCTVIGARRPLIAFNVNLNTPDVAIAKAIAKKIRHSSGGLRFCKAIGIDLAEKGQAQVSMNLTDFTQTSVYQVVEMIRMEAARYGVSLGGSELIGMIPIDAITDSIAYYWGLEDFSPRRILELNI